MNNQIPYFMNPQDSINNHMLNYNNTPNMDIEKIMYKINR